jgi:nucleoid-associated protein YejK
MPENNEETFTLHRIIMHKIDKTGKIGTAQLRDTLLSTSSLDIKKFAQAISFSYHKRTSKEFAKFKSSPTPIYENLLKTYMADGETDEKFIQFSKDATNHLKDEMNKKPTSTGGYLIFADYSMNDRFIMAVLLNNKAGYTVDESSLIVKMIQELNVEQIAMAGFVNMSIYTNNNADTRRYLSFMKGVKNISDYFVAFIGADEDKETSREMTRVFIGTLKEYFKSKEYESDKISALEQTVYNFCEDKRTNKESVTIQAISALLNPEEPNEFFEFSQGENYQLSTTIESIDKSQIDRLKLYKYSGDGMSLSFKRNLYENGDISLIENDTKLVIKMSDSMKQSIINELK